MNEASPEVLELAEYYRTVLAPGTLANPAACVAVDTGVCIKTGFNKYRSISITIHRYDQALGASLTSCCGLFWFMDHTSEQPQRGKSSNNILQVPQGRR